MQSHTLANQPVLFQLISLGLALHACGSHDLAHHFMDGRVQYEWFDRSRPYELSSLSATVGPVRIRLAPICRWSTFPTY